MFKLIESSPKVAEMIVNNIIIDIFNDKRLKMPRIWDNLYSGDITSTMNKESNPTDFNMYTAVCHQGMVCLYSDFIESMQCKGYVFNQPMQSASKEDVILPGDLIEITINKSNQREEAYQNQAEKAYTYCSNDERAALTKSLEGVSDTATLLIHDIFVTTKAAMLNVIEKREKLTKVKASLNKFNLSAA